MQKDTFNSPYEHLAFYMGVPASNYDAFKEVFNGLDLSLSLEDVIRSSNILNMIDIREDTLNDIYSFIAINGNSIQKYYIEQSESGIQLSLSDDIKKIIPLSELDTGACFINTDILNHLNLFRQFNDNLLLTNPLSDIDYSKFMGCRVGGEPVVMSEENANNYIKGGWEKNIISRFNDLFQTIQTSSDIFLLAQREDYNVYGNRNRLLLTTPDDSQWIGGFNVGDRYIKPEFRGKGFGSDVIVERMSFPALGIINGTGYYSPAGYETRKNAFFKLTGRKPWENNPSLDQTQTLD